MAQEELKWLKEELHRVERNIEAKEQQLLEAREANKSIAITYSMAWERNRLIEKEDKVWSTLQVRMASLAGGVLAAAQCQLLQ